jgi:hypothetical protein
MELGDIEHELRSIDVHAGTLRSLVCERALGNDVFDRFGRSVETDPSFRDSDASSWLTKLWMSHDRAFYLETMTEDIRRAGLPYPDAVAVKTDWPKWAAVSAMITPNTHQALRPAADLEATLRVAIVALIARRDGSAAGRHAADTLLDPFDGKPLRTRVDPDGLFVVWSVGGDHTDDGGREFVSEDDRLLRRDIAWRVRTP